MNGFQIDAVNNALDELRAENAELQAANKLLRTAYLLPEDKVLQTEIKRLTLLHEISERQAQLETKRLRAAITRAKDALLDGQSTQWVHDLLVAALTESKP